MAQRANITAAELLALAPENPLDQEACVTFFAECLRWSEIERYEPVYEVAWLGIKEQDRLCKRNIHLLALKSELDAYIEIYSIEQPTPEPEPPIEPDITEAKFLPDLDGYYDYPIKGERATSPDIDDMPALPEDQT